MELKAPWVQTRKGLIGGRGELAQFWVCHLAFVPGRPAELLYTGYIGQAHCPLVHLLNDGRSETTVPGVTDVVAFGFGKNLDGAGYPAVLFRGKYEGVEAFWLTLDWFKSVQVRQRFVPEQLLVRRDVKHRRRSVEGWAWQVAHQRRWQGRYLCSSGWSRQEELTNTRPAISVRPSQALTCERARFNTAGHHGS